MSSLPKEIQRAEIIDWWETERYRVYRAYIEAQKDIRDRAVANAEKLFTVSLRSLPVPFYRARNDFKKQIAIKKQILAEVKELNEKLVGSFQESIEVSVSRVESDANYKDGINRGYGALIAGSGLAGTIGFLAPRAFAITWPGLIIFGVSLLFFVRKSKKTRFINHLDEYVSRLLLDEADDTKNASSWVQFKMEIDRVAQIRMHSLT